MPVRNRTSRSFLSYTSPIDAAMRETLDIVPKINPLSSFNRYYSVYPEFEKDSIFQWIFMTRPMLNILQNFVSLPDGYNWMDRVGGMSVTNALSNDAKNNAVIGYIAKTHGECLLNLSEYSYSHHFIPYFTGRIESYQVPDFEIKVYSLSQPYTGYTLPIAGHGIESTTGGNMSITYRDDGDYRILTAHRAWVEYIHGVNYGAFNPKRAANIGPVESNWIDYSASVYMIATKAEGHEIVWFDKYTGIFPTVIPESIFSFNRNSQVSNEISITYNFFHHRACDPCILRDFNYNAFGGKTPSVKYSEYSHIDYGAGNGQVGTPFIAVGTGNNSGKFYLEWASI